jgi:carboxyl-terminal processing protease
MKDYFSRSMLYVPGLWLMPNDPIYKNKLIVLVDQACASACEDFVMPLKVTGRAVVVGERTFGSSGQPKIVDFGDGMRLQIGAKRMMFGDGRPFEGVGIIPDIIIYPSAEQLERGDDPVLEKAVDLSSSN